MTAVYKYHYCTSIACLTVAEKFRHAVCPVPSSSVQSPWQEAFDLGCLSKVPFLVKKHPLRRFRKEGSNGVSFPRVRLASKERKIKTPVRTESRTPASLNPNL